MKKGFKFPPLLMAIIIVVAAFAIFAYAIPPLLPVSLLIQYMVIVIIGVLLYFSFDDDVWSSFTQPISATLQLDKTWPIRWLLLLLIPALVAYTVYTNIKPDWSSPVELRQVHPAPPSKLKVYGKTYDLKTLKNPVRTEVVETMPGDPDKAWEIYNESIGKGQETYYQNCFYCHGDLMFGEGVFADGFNPVPINFQDVGTIAQMEEAFIFWRITTGGPGLPKEGTPWNSAMPVWHEMLDEEQVWDVITFIYDYVGQVPRIWEQDVSKVVTGMKDKLIKQRKSLTGNELYQLRCFVCHGEKGMGDGYAAERLYPKPRDFSLGLYKYKTSPGTIPVRDDDLFNTIKFGLPGTAMPGWAKIMTDEQIKSLIPIIKGFDTSATFAPEEAEDEDFDDDGRYIKADFQSFTEIEPLQGQVAYSEESVAKGKAAFKVCKECHGEAGRGNITSGKKLADDWGFRLWPRDLNKPWTWRATERVEAQDATQIKDQIIKNIYTRLSIGIPGTPMPAHRAEGEGNEDPVSLEDRWHIANYVYSLREQEQPLGNSVIQAKKITGELPDDINDKAWQDATTVSLRLVPNIIKEERLFTPLNTSLTARAIYNEEEIAFLITVNDRTKSLPGDSYFTDLQDEELTMHSDAIAVQFPKADAFATAPIVEKPLFRHGDKKHHTSIWYWNAGSEEPKLPAKTTIFTGKGPNERPEVMKTYSDVSAQGAWKDGQWQVIMKRKRMGTENEISFAEGQFIPISFADWDGSNGEAGSKHSMTSWYWLLLPPEENPTKLYGISGLAGLLVFILGFLLVRSQRKSFKASQLSS